jgi:predicted XRE-type DNA-binding protein
MAPSILAARWKLPPKETGAMKKPSETPELLNTRAHLMAQLERHGDALGLEPSQAAALFGVEPTRMADLKLGDPRLFTIDQLLGMATRAGLRARAHLQVWESL